MHYNYKLDENILKTLSKRNILPTDLNKKTKLIVYYDKFKTSNLVINNNSSPSIEVLPNWLNLNYSIKTTHYVSIWYQFNSTMSKKTFLPKKSFGKFLLKTQQY